MAEHTDNPEQQVETIIRAAFAHQPADEQAPTNAWDETQEKRSVIDVDLYHLAGGAVLLVPNTGTNPLDTNAVESTALTLETAPLPETPTLPIVEDEQQEADPSQDVQLASAAIAPQRRGKRSVVLVALVLLCLLVVGAASYLYLLPLTATATVTITGQHCRSHD